MYFDISNLPQNQVINITVGGGGAGGYITRRQGIEGNSSSMSMTINSTTYTFTAYGGNGGYAGITTATSANVNGGNTLITNTYNFSTTISYNGNNGNNISLGRTLCKYPINNTTNYYVNATLYGAGGKGGLARASVAGNLTSNLGYGGTGGYVRIYQMID